MIKDCTPHHIPGTFLIFETLIHILILFSFLTFFYIFKISKIETNAVGCELKSITYSQTMDMLRKQDNMGSQADIFQSLLADRLKSRGSTNFKTSAAFKAWLQRQGLPAFYTEKVSEKNPPPTLSPDANNAAHYITTLLGLSTDPHGIKTTLRDSKETLNGLFRLYRDKDETTKTYNTGLFQSAFIVVGFLALLSIVYATLIRKSCVICPKYFNIGHVLASNFWVFLIVGAVEVIFFLNVGLKWQPAPPSSMNAAFVKSINKYMGGTTLTKEEQDKQDDQECNAKRCKCKYEQGEEVPAWCKTTNDPCGCDNSVSCNSHDIGCTDVWPCAGEKNLEDATWPVVGVIVGAVIIVFLTSMFAIKYKMQLEGKDATTMSTQLAVYTAGNV